MIISLFREISPLARPLPSVDHHRWAVNALPQVYLPAFSQAPHQHLGSPTLPTQLTLKGAGEEEIKNK